MNCITKEDIRSALKEHLKHELEIEVMKSVKDKVPTQKSIDNKREKLKADFEYHNWLKSLERSLRFMQDHKLSLATHISKGVHSSVRSDNLLVSMLAIDSDLDFASSIDIPNPKLDANSNNTGSHIGHLKNIVNFLNIEIFNYRFYLLIKRRDPVMKDFFEKNLIIDLFDYLYNLLNFKVVNPTIDERNKQTLFPVENNSYHCVVPLFPSSLTEYVHYYINNIRYSELFKKAREIRFDKKLSKEKPASYKEIPDLAAVKLGGNNTQNVSRLNNSKGGFHYLLPSLPPSVRFKSDTFKPSKFAHSIFSASLAKKMVPILHDLYDVIESKPNNVAIRDARKKTMDEILHKLFEFAGYMRNELPPGWSVDHQLDDCEAFWLDPMRADLPDQAEWKAKRENPNNEWDKQIIHRFAQWINALLQEKFNDIREDFATPEHNEWEREIEAMTSVYARAGKGVFL